MTSRAGKPRRGFTAIELTIAIAVMVALSGMTTQAVLSGLRSHAVNRACDAVEGSAATARDLALRAHAINAADTPDGGFAGKRYGVVLIPASDATPARVAVTWGAEPDSDSLWHQGGEVAKQTELEAGARLFIQGDDGVLRPLDGPVGWAYQHGTGIACADAGSGTALAFIGDADLAADVIDVRPPVRISETIVIATPDGALANALTLLPSGDLVIARR